MHQTDLQNQRRQLRRAVASSFLGSTIEYYDFLLYALTAAVVFDRVFFSNLDPVAGTIASLGTLAAGYVARPIGGIVFGHFGDRIGRKRMLVLSMTIMGGACVLIGMLPTYAQIGVAAPIILVLLRLVQGVAVGGEWGGAVLISVEHATSRRGLWGSFTNAGAPTGAALASLALTAAAAIAGEQGFLEWGWRIPFLLSGLLLLVGLFVRARVQESPVFRESATAQDKPRSPLAEVLRFYWKPLLLTIGACLGAFVVQGAATTYLISYGVQVGLPRQDVLNALTVSAFASIVTILLFASFSDRIGRRPVIVIGALGAAAWSFALFPLAQMESVGMFYLAIVVCQGVFFAAMWGPLAALCSEVFATRSRYTGASLAFQLAGAGGGVAPVVFASVAAATGGATLPISLIIAATCLLTVICVLLLGETSGRRLQTVGATDSGAAPATLQEEPQP